MIIIIILLVAIVLLEGLRLWIYIQDSRRVKRTNKRVEEQQERAIKFTERQNAEWKRIRKAEIEELRHLAESSDTMKRIYDEWLENNKKFTDA